MLGAIAGDIIGSVYEFAPHRSTEFELFGPKSRPTDDTVLTCAVAESILDGTDFGASLHKWGNKYPNRGYGGNFLKWLGSSSPEPYHSIGNGSAMRVSPVAWAFDTEDEVLQWATVSALPTHNHSEGVAGAQAVALATFWSRKGVEIDKIRTNISKRFDYRLDSTVDDLRPRARFDETCPISVPEALCCAFEAESVEHAIRLAVSLGADADTQAAIAGSIAEARFGPLSGELEKQVLERIDTKMRKLVNRFRSQYC